MYRSEEVVNTTVSKVMLLLTTIQVYSPLPDNARLQFSSQGSMTINSVRKDDGGIYKCIASDGDISSTAMLELIIQRKLLYSLLRFCFSFCLLAKRFVLYEAAKNILNLLQT